MSESALDNTLRTEGQFRLGGELAVEINRHLYDMGLPGVMFASTSMGVAVIIDRSIRGFVSRDEWLHVVGATGRV